MFVISDACVLIDIEKGELTEAMFSLPYQFKVPDILFAEELATRHQQLLQFGLISQIMNGELIAEAYGLRQKYARLSVNDCLGLTLAKHENCLLLTGDKELRRVAGLFNIQTHGTIWLVEQVIKQKKIAVEIVRGAFEKMKSSGSRLPWKEAEQMLKNISYAEKSFCL